MKKIFRSFYGYSKQEFNHLWDKSIFVFDANVLLNLYRYSEDTRNDLLSVLEGLKERIWIPNQVALEYQFNRLSVIYEQKNSYKNIVRVLSEQAKKSLDSLGNELNKYRKRHANIDIKELISNLEDCYGSLITKVQNSEKEHLDYSTDDLILNTLSVLFDDKVGNFYTQAQLEELYKDGAKRYKGDIPPGYKDLNDKKGQMKYYNKLFFHSEYGDLIMWDQIIQKAQSDQVDIIFVTDDEKEDWWQIVGGETIGPRIELINEFNSKTQKDIYIYKPYKFVEYAKGFLGKEIDKSSIEEIKEIKNTDILVEHQFNKELAYITDEDIDMYQNMIERANHVEPIQANNIYYRANKWLERRNVQNKLSQNVAYLEITIQQLMNSLPPNRRRYYRDKLNEITKSDLPIEISNGLQFLYNEIIQETD